MAQNMVFREDEQKAGKRGVCIGRRQGDIVAGLSLYVRIAHHPPDSMLQFAFNFDDWSWSYGGCSAPLVNIRH